MRYSKGKRTILTIFLLLFSVLLASCGKAETPAADPSVIWSETRYAAQRVPLEVYGTLPSAAIQGDTVYFTAYLSSDAGVALLCSAECSEGKISQLTGYERYVLPPLTAAQKAGTEKVDRHQYLVEQICPADEHIWMLANRFHHDAEGQLDENTLLLLQANPADGAVTQEIVLSEDEHDSIRLSLCCDAQGNVYAYFGAGIYIFDSTGAALGKISAGVGRMFPLPDGRCGFLSDSQDGAQWRLQTIDPQKLSFQEESMLYSIEQDAISRNMVSIYPSSGRYDFLCANDQSLYGYHIGENGQPGTGEHILTWLNCDIDSTGIKAVSETGDGFACVTNTDAFGSEIVRLSPCDSSEQEPVTITLACQTLPYEVSTSVLRFNRQSPDIRVQIRDYGAVSAKSGLAAGLDRFTTDLITGNVSDVFCTGNMDEQMLIDRGMLEDLWPWIDADETLGGRKALVQPLFDAMSQNGKLYSVTNSFHIETAFGFKDMVGGKEGWPVEELIRTYQSKENCRGIWYPVWDNRETILGHMIATCAESFIDRQNWTASFDSPEFIAQLEYLMLVQEDFVPKEQCANWMTDREVLLRSIPIYDIGEMKTRFAPLEVPFSEITLAGYPGVAGNGGSFVVENRLAMWSGSPHKEEAWAFLRSLLLPENQRDLSWRIPSNKAVCDAVLRNLEAEGIWEYPWTQEDTEHFWNYVDGIKVVERTEENLAAIIRDEAARYFAGDQTAQAAAKAIQSRVNLYLGE